MEKMPADKYPQTIVNDTLHMLLGPRIGRGTYRDVYEMGTATEPP